MMNEIQLSSAVFELLDGTRLADKQHTAMMLLTVSEDDWPHTAMVSVGEVVALNRTELRIGLWPGTTTTTNFVRTGKATLVIVQDGKAIYIRLLAERLPMCVESTHPRERFAASITAYREDVAKYAHITSGIQIDLLEPDQVLARWEETIQELMK